MDVDIVRPMLLIGVKTAVVTSFPRRQAIRETWANPATLPRDVKVLFLGCEPNVTDFQNEHDRRRVLSAVVKEKAVYKDLLTEELDCTDSYRGLSDKVKSFMHLSAAEFPNTKFVMLVDDDIYVKIDQLAEHLRKLNQSDLYMGEVWSVEFGKQVPIRYSESQYFLPEDQYPMRILLPYATGPHYVVSMRNVRFIAKNYWRLTSMNGLEDVSTGIWLRAMQIHAEHTSDFSCFRSSMKCSDNLVSFADLSPLGIRSIHSNRANNRSFCHGLHSVTWLRQFNMLPRLSEMLQRPIQEAEQLDSRQLGNDNDNNVDTLWNIEVFVNDLNISKYLEVTSIVSTPSEAGIKVKYFPSAETLFSYTQRVCAQVQTLMKRTEFNSMMCHAVAVKLRTQLQLKFLSIERALIINRATVELWRYNIFVADPEASPIIIAHHDNAVYIPTVLESLFVKVYEHHKRPILVFPEWILHKHYGSKPDVFVFSIVDADCQPLIKPACQEFVAKYIDEYLSSGTSHDNQTTTIIMTAGEPADTQGLDERVLLLSTVSGLNRRKYAYLPVASTSFGERLQHSPTSLLLPVISSEPEERRFCAYLFARCDRPQREYMFDILNDVEPVDALGICAGSSRLPNVSYAASRYSTWYNDDAVATFQNYKFVIAFENSGVPGYITEKLVNPFLAGSIPIYLGNSTTITEIFNPKSFIDCGRFETLRDCASYVLKVHNSPELYTQMRRESVVGNVSAFNEAFSWHPSIPSRSLADKVAKWLHT
ncbi:putative membrane protein [Phytophthora megakarya]|uniref:Fucosyltransferase n=1 Tax=Phytophthora megakarya TaxID=4795 RepID=A0A225WQX1_9STRA|nr:putative membrane protein [Phytophthora megakarya]